MYVHYPLGVFLSISYPLGTPPDLQSGVKNVLTFYALRICNPHQSKRKKMARFIDPRVDWAFKRIFGSEDTKECLITFLNGLFEDELVIKDVTFAKTAIVRQAYGGRVYGYI